MNVKRYCLARRIDGIAPGVPMELEYLDAIEDSAGMFVRFDDYDAIAARLALLEGLLLEAAEWLKPDIGMDRELQGLYGRIRRAVGTPTSDSADELRQPSLTRNPDGSFTLED